MRAGQYRTKKYDKKIRGIVLTGQSSRKAATVPREVEIEAMVNALVGFDIMRGHYMIFAKQINKAIKKFKGQTLINEINILQKTWEARGLDGSLLEKIRKGMSIEISFELCSFDEGRFNDGRFSVIPEYVCIFDEGKFDENRFGV